SQSHGSADQGMDDEEAAEKKLQLNEPLSKKDRAFLAKRHRTGRGFGGSDSSYGRRRMTAEDLDILQTAEHAAELVPAHVARCPAFTRIVDWISTLLDSNLARILLLIFADKPSEQSSAGMGDVVVDGQLDGNEGRAALQILHDLRDIVVAHHAAL